MMRRHLLLLITLCLHIAARGQTIASLADIDQSGLPQPTTAKQLRYWFDDDGSSVKVVSQLSGQQILDVAALADGLHTLHFQIIDNTNAVAIVSSAPFLKVGSVEATATARQLRYWFDGDAGSVRNVNGTNGTYAIDALSLTEGLHTLHFQIIDSKNEVTVASSAVFMRAGSQEVATAAQQLRYWFDGDDQTVRTVASANGVHSIDTNALTEGLHTIHYQVVGADNAVYSVVSGLFLKTRERGESTDVAARKLMYWFDDETSIKTADMTDGMQLLDASELVDGLHTIHYQVLCNNGQMTSAVSSVFLRVNFDQGPTTAQSLRYWFDNEQTAMEVALASGVQMVDASKLEEGLHTIHYQVIDNTGALGSAVSSVFLKMSGQESATQPASLRYWYDDEQTITESALATGTQTLDASKLVDGLHTIHYQVVDNKGAVSATISAVFLKMGSLAEAAPAKSIRYWFDNDAASMKIVEANKGSQVLDVTGMLSGLHTLHYQLVDAEGQVGTPVAAMFMKGFDKAVADGENRITQYRYWLNDNSQAMQTVNLDKAVNPYQLIALLPMQKEPIRSQQFRFEITDGQPTIYAENTFNVRFYDAADYFVDADKAFVDYSVKQTLTDIELIESGVRAVTAKPTGNDIKWYKLDAEPGDSLQFRLDRAATIQLFAPSGEELFSASGSESVGWSGCHTKESGTYYLALHDVTANYGNTISIDYNHIDKYAVLRQDVAVVGNGGCSTITFEGNGFRDLYAVDLYNAQGDTIHYVYIGHESDAVTSVVFDFTDAVLGTYHAKFHFTEEDKVLNNLVTVEEARDIELTTTVTYPSTFLRANGRTTYYAKISNEGNMTSYRTPVYVFIKSLHKDGVSRIKMGGLDLPELYNDINTDSLNTEDKKIMSDTNERIGDTHYFVKSAIYDETLNDSIFIWAAYFFTDIAPKTVKNISAEVCTQDDIEVWFTTPKANNPLSGKFFMSHAGSRRLRYKINREEYCCMRSKIECFASIVADGVGIANSIASLTPGCPHQLALGVADCVAGIVNQTVNATGKVLCDDPSYEENFWDRVQGILNGISVINTLTGCASKILPAGKFKDFIKAINNLSGNDFLTAFSVGVDIGNCVNAFTEKIPNCPPNPDGGGGQSNPVNSFDPNDIYGYTASSGSHAVKEELTDVYYRIEFENDTTFATAAAHDIYVTDTLDATKFDLSTFAPTRMRIGEKSAELTGDKNFVTTIDMRPEINAIAQVEGTYDESKGVAKWHITSLDPMTMEPTDDVMQGVLPVNTNGQGIGEVSYDIKLKDGLAHGTEVNNRASIVFDTNEPIMTPTWTNIVDATAPESHVTDVKMQNDSTATVSIEATDELSGPWRYDVYVQYGNGAWFKAAENVPIDTTASVKVYEGIDHGFYVVVTDSAGNVEQKNAEREFTFEVFGSQIDTDTRIELAEGWNWMSHNQEEPLMVAELQSAGSRMLGQTEELYEDARFGWMGDLEELLPTQMYKLQMDGPLTVHLSGRLFNAGFRAVPLYEGWNWMGYPVARTMTPAEALAKLEAEEGDMLIGQDGMATYSDGQWTGTLTEMNPGQGYMFRSQSDKNLFLNATAQASSRRANSPRHSSLPDDWTVNKRKYPNVMGMIAQLWHDDALADSGEWQLGAFCGDECRGVAQTVGDGEPAQTVLMMNVYGTGSEPISFRVMNRETGEVLDAAEQEPFRADVVGTMQQPYALHIGGKTGISLTTGPAAKGEGAVYLLDGRRVDQSQVGKGIYVVSGGRKNRTQMMIRK